MSTIYLYGFLLLTHTHVLGPLVPLFWISGDVSSGGLLYSHMKANIMYIPWDPPLVLHIANLLTVSIVDWKPGSYLTKGYSYVKLLHLLGFTFSVKLINYLKAKTMYLVQPLINNSSFMKLFLWHHNTSCLMWGSGRQEVGTSSTRGGSQEMYIKFAFSKTMQVRRNPLWIWNPEETSPEIQNRGTSGPKWDMCQPKKKGKPYRNYKTVHNCT